MKRVQAQLLVLTVIVGLVGMVEGCSASRQGSAGPVAPSAPAMPIGPTTASASTYTISGVITVFGGGPVGGMKVGAYPYPWGEGATTQTDGEGHYSLQASAQKVGLEIWSPGGDYATAFKYDVEPRDQVVNFVVQPTFNAPAAGGTVSGTISGDEFIAGDDDFGGRCTGTPCKVVTFDCCTFAGRSVEVQLRWTDPSRQLALYFARGDVYFPPARPPSPADRVCCSSELVGTYAFNFDFDRFAIGFEQSGAGPPAPSDHQSFELTVRRPISASR